MRGAPMTRLTKRFEVRAEAGRGWAVLDRFIGWPALVGGEPQIEMDLEDALDVAEQLNAMARSGRRLRVL